LKKYINIFWLPAVVFNYCIANIYLGITLVIFIAMISGRWAEAQELPGTLSYQGILKDNSGSIVPDGQYTMDFEIFDAAAAGNSLWTEQQNASVKGGRFNVVLGAVNPLTENNITFRGPLWLGISVNGTAFGSRIPFTSSAYSRSTSEVFGIRNIFPSDGPVGIGTIMPHSGAKLDVIGKVRIDTVPLVDTTYRVLVIDDADQIVKYVTFNMIENLGLKGPKGPPGPKGPIGPKGPPGPPGGIGGIFLGPFIIIDADSNEVLRINRDGTSWHKGREKFEDGIEIPTNDGGKIVINEFGITIYDEEGNIITNFNFLGTSIHTGREKYKGGIEVPTTNGGKVVIDSLGITIYDRDGNIITDFDQDSTSIHTGRETYYGGIEIPTESGGKVVIDQHGVTIYDSDGNIVTGFEDDGTSFHTGVETYEGGLKIPITGGGKIEIKPNGSIVITNADGVVVTEFKVDGTSTHTGREKYKGGIEVPTSNGGKVVIDSLGITIYDSNGNIITNFNEDSTSTHTGLETYKGGIEIPITGGGKIEIKPNGSIVVTDEAGGVVTEFKADGTSTHTGLEKFKGGIEIPTENGGKVVINEFGITIYDADGNIITDFDQAGPSIHKGPEHFYGGITVSTTGSGAALQVDGTITATRLIAEIKNFRIDHPLDPANKYLYHNSIESSEMLNIYNGNAVFNDNGEVWIDLPDWFQAVNKDFRYQLTCIGGYAQVFIAEGVANNRFRIAGGRPGLKVSWQVSGVRDDAFARHNPNRVESLKPLSETGKYLHPEYYNAPPNMKIGAANNTGNKSGAK